MGNNEVSSCKVQHTIKSQYVPDLLVVKSKCFKKSTGIPVNEFKTVIKPEKMAYTSII